MGASQLQAVHREMFGAEHRIANCQHLRRKIAWHIQAAREGGLATAPSSSQMSSHAAFGDDEAEFLKFSVDLGAPQSGFSSAMRRIRPRISAVIFGRPPRGRDRQRQ